MTSLVTGKMVKKLTEENIKLCEELVFIRERMKMFIEFKILFDFHSNKIKQSLTSNEWQKFEKLLTKIDEFVDTNNANDNSVTEVNTRPTKRKQSEETNEDNEQVIDRKSIVKTDGKYKCSLDGCDKSYTVRYQLIKHQRRVHFKQNEFICFYPDCHYKTFSKISFDKHTKDHPNSNRKHKCSFDGCEQRFLRRRDVVRHENLIHLNLGKFYCKYPNCEYRTYDKEFFDKHIANHSDYAEVTAQTITYICDYEGCGKEFGSKLSWINHRSNFHMYLVPCTHPGCQYSAPSKTQLEVHMMKHTKDTPFVCKVEGCDKRFKHEISYKNHVEVHKNKYFKCAFDGCDKTFQTKTGLMVHQKSVHIRDTLYVCQWPACEYSTYRKDNFNKHQKDHGDQRHACDYPNCSAKYKDGYSLKAHQLKYHGIGDGHVCSWPGCDHKAITRNKLKIHEKSHTKDK